MLRAWIPETRVRLSQAKPHVKSGGTRIRSDLGNMLNEATGRSPCLSRILTSIKLADTLNERRLAVSGKVGTSQMVQANLFRLWRLRHFQVLEGLFGMQCRLFCIILFGRTDGRFQMHDPFGSMWVCLGFF